jgi:hypothetical protein
MKHDYGALVDKYRGKQKYWEENLSQCHFIHHRFHTDWPDPASERPATNHLIHDMPRVRDDNQIEDNSIYLRPA